MDKLPFVIWMLGWWPMTSLSDFLDTKSKEIEKDIEKPEKESESVYHLISLLIWIFIGALLWFNPTIVK